MTRDVSLLLRDGRGNTYQVEGQLDLPAAPARGHETPPPRDVLAVLLGRVPARLRGWLADKVAAFYRRYAEQDGPLPAPEEHELRFAEELIARMRRQVAAPPEPITGTLVISGFLSEPSEV